MAKRTNSSISSANASDFLREVDGVAHVNGKFLLTRLHQTFVIENLDSVEDPSEILKHCFQQCIDQTMQKSREAGIEADKIGVTISSQLLNSDIQIPLRALNENTVDAILNQFLKVMQNHTDSNVYGEPFQVAVTGIKSSALPRERKTIGKGMRKFIFSMKQNINDACILQIQNEDQYCLFYALELMRIYISKEKKTQRFSEYRKNVQRQGADVKEMMCKAGIPRNLSEYTLEEWGPVVQDYYNRAYGGGEFYLNLHI